MQFSSIQTLFNMGNIGFMIFVLLTGCKDILSETKDGQPNMLNVTQTNKIEHLVTIEVTRLITIPITVEVTRWAMHTPTPAPTTTTLSSKTPIAHQDTDQSLENYSGTYRYIPFEGSTAGCILSINHEQNVGLFDNLSFEIECSRGEPSYNMGRATDTVPFDNNLFDTAAWKAPYGDCYLVFAFGTDTVTVVQNGHPLQCGFGGGVVATGKYKLINRAIPNVGCVSQNYPCNSEP